MGMENRKMRKCCKDKIRLYLTTEKFSKINKTGRDEGDKKYKSCAFGEIFIFFFHGSKKNNLCLNPFTITAQRRMRLSPFFCFEIEIL